MSKTTIYLVRHCQTIPQKELKNREWSLTKKGHEQAANLGEHLKTLTVDAVYCSPFIRARQSLTPFLNDTKLPVYALEGLAEHDFAQEYLTPEEYRHEMEKYWQDSFLTPEIGGESGAQCQVRILDAINEVAHLHDGEHILMCSHAQPIAWALRTLYPQYSYQDWANMRMPEVFKLIYEDNQCKWDRSYTSPDM